jgi:opine dehydrogenase
MAATAELTLAGHAVRLWNRRPATLAPLEAAGGVAYEGVLGDGFARPEAMTQNLAEALAGADLAMVCLPSIAHGRVAEALIAERAALPVVLNPGHTGGALHLAARFADAGLEPPPVAELSTLTYVARKPSGDRVRVTGAAERVRAACLPAGEAALALAAELYPAAQPERDVLATGLSNVNLVLHPPAAVLGVAWVEATRGDFRFYADATTPAVARTMAALDAERRAVAAAYGHELDPLELEMAAIGTADREAAARGDLRAAVADGEANRSIMAPDSLEHRYYTEDFGYGVLPFVELARIAGVVVPVADALLRLADTFIEGGVVAAGLTARRMGIAGLDAAGLLERVETSAVRPRA